MFAVKEISDIEVAFPASVAHLMPRREEIPGEFKEYPGTEWNQIFNDWFYHYDKGGEPVYR